MRPPLPFALCLALATCTSAKKQSAPPQTTAPKEWSVSVSQTDFGAELNEHETITVRSSGEVVVTAPHGGGEERFSVSPDALDELARLLTAPGLDDVESSELHGEGVKRGLSIETPSGKRSWTFGGDVPEPAARIIAAVHDVREKLAARGDFTVTVGQEEFGVGYVKKDTVTVHSDGKVEVETAEGKKTSASVALAELAVLERLLTGPELAAQKPTEHVGEGEVVHLTVVTPAGTYTLELKLPHGDPVPDPAGHVLVEVERLRALAFHTPLLFTVEFAQNDMGATAARPDWFLVRSTGKLALRHADGRVDPEVTVPAAELDTLRSLLLSSAVAGLASNDPGGEGHYTYFKIRTQAGTRDLTFYEELPPGAEALRNELLRLRKNLP